MRRGFGPALAERLLRWPLPLLWRWLLRLLPWLPLLLLPWLRRLPFGSGEWHASGLVGSVSWHHIDAFAAVWAAEGDGVIGHANAEFGLAGGTQHDAV